MTINQQARSLKSEMSKIRLAQASIKDLCTLIKCRKAGEYEEMFTTTLYAKHGGEYCQYLQLLH